MGIIYKLKKHKDLKMDLTQGKEKLLNEKCENVNENSNENEKFCENLNFVANCEAPFEENTKATSEVNAIEKQFTAEHILQLCRFLAEKSRKNKNIHKQQQSPRKLSIFKDTHNTSFNFDLINDASLADDTLPLLQSKHSSEKDAVPQHFSMETLSSTFQESHLKHSLAINCPQQYGQSQHQEPQKQLKHHQYNYQQQDQQLHQNIQQLQKDEPYHCQDGNHQEKRDILLKIRNKIFERKRQREIAHMQQRFGVWRPW